MRASGVFTGTTNSPSRSTRQSIYHSTIRAGRNLPDKEFRYLRTVIVTAAVYWGFSQKLWLAPDIPPSPCGTGQVSGSIRHLSILQGPVFLLNSWLNHFTETIRRWYALSRSYSVNLPSSFS